MKVTAWIRWHGIDVAAVRCEVGETIHQIKQRALDQHEVVPCCSWLYPRYTPGTIRSAIYTANEIQFT